MGGSIEPRKVFVVETWLKNPGRWYQWSTHMMRAAAWEATRNARERHRDRKFRTTPYVSTKP